MSVRDDIREFKDRDIPKYGEPCKLGEVVGRTPFSGVVGKLRARGESRESLSMSVRNGE